MANKSAVDRGAPKLGRPKGSKNKAKVMVGGRARGGKASGGASPKRGGSGTSRKGKLAAAAVSAVSTKRAASHVPPRAACSHSNVIHFAKRDQMWCTHCGAAYLQSETGRFRWHKPKRGLMVAPAPRKQKKAMVVKKTPAPKAPSAPVEEDEAVDEAPIEGDGDGGDEDGDVPELGSPELHAAYMSPA